MMDVVTNIAMMDVVTNITWALFLCTGIVRWKENSIIEAE